MSGSKLSSPSENHPTSPVEDHADRPVSFTVHNMPQVDRAAEPGTKGARLKLLLLFLVSAAPVIASYFTYYVIRPEGRRNYGELIEPQKPLPALEGVAMDGRKVALPSLKDQWLLISVADSACDAACEKQLYMSRQLRESLGKDKDRMDWVWLRTGQAEVPQAMRPALAAATVLQVPEADLAAWLAPAPGHLLSEHLYLVDPMGHWMMRFPAHLEPRKALKDLERLMRGSASWDLAGRP